MIVEKKNRDFYSMIRLITVTFSPSLTRKKMKRERERIMEPFWYFSLIVTEKEGRKEDEEE